MINVSNAFKQGLENGEKVWIEVDITFSDGTSKHLKNEIMNGNNSFSDCAESSSFPIGCVICKSMTLELDNTSDQWKDYYFYMAKVHAYLKMQIDADTIETIDKGVYTITTPEQYGEILSFTALDDMYKTNAVFSTKLVLPQTVESLVRDACGTLGITAGFSKMAHGDLIINELPKDMTYRQLFGWAAMLDTANARLDNNGSLQFIRWSLDATPSIELKDYISMPTVSSDDIVITGINIISGDNSETYGTSGYILSMENNLVGESDLATVAAQIGDSIIGAKFRNLQGDMAFNPLLEFGDVAYTYDRNLNQYVTPLTDVSYAVNGKTTVKTQADDPIRGMSLYYSGATKAIVAARQLVEKEKNARELAIEELQKSLSVGSGLFATYVQQEDGSTISYFHDKGTLAESKNVIKITAEAIGVSNDGGKTYPFGFELTGTMITKLLYAEGINADYINSGALTVRDKNGDIIFQVNMDTNTVYMNPDFLVIGDQTLTEKLTAMDNSIAEAKNMTMQLTNDYQSITTDANGNITGTFPTVTTTAQVMYGTNDVTNDCTYTVTKSNNVTGSWNDSTHTYTVTGLSADNGWVDIKATYLRALSITKRFTVAKLKAGKNGINGLDGLQGEKGEQGIPGKDGIAGTNGTDGKTYYLHIAYANSADGRTGFSVSDGTNKLYIGQYTDIVKEDSTDPKKYTWSKIRGEPGADGKPGTDGKPGRTYIIEPSCTVLKRGSDKIISPNFLEFNAYYRDGDSATRYAYSGRFVIEETADGNTWKTIYTSSANETSVKHYLYTVLTDGNGQTITGGNGTTVGIPRDITNIRCKLYAAGGTTNMLDMQSVAVVIDVDNLTQTDIVNILSNNGAWKGLYYKNGQLYISFSAALGGELTLGGKNNGNGALYLYDKDGKLLSILDNRGLLCGYDLRDTNDYFTMPGAPNGYEMYVWDKVEGVLIASQRGVGMQWFANQDNRYALHMLADYEFEVYLNDGVDSTSNPYTPLRCTHDYTEVFNQLKTYNVEQYTNAYTLMLKLDGTVVRSASSAKRYKDVREDIDAQSIEKWYGIQTVWAKYKDGYLSSEDENNGKYMPMFLADDVEQHMPEAAIHMDGKIEDWNYRVMIPAMFAMLKQQKSEIDSLKQELDEIKQLLRKE